MPGRAFSLRMPIAVLLCGAALPALGADREASPDTEASFTHPRDSSFLVLSYTQSHDMLAEEDPTPLLRIYGDGRVRVHIPRYMKRAGDYTMRLEPEELQSLLRSLYTSGVLTFDHEVVAIWREQAQVARASSEGGTLFDISDDTWTILRVRLGQLEDPAAGHVIDDLDHTVTWPNVEWEAKHYPSVEALSGLATAERSVRAMLSHSRLEAVQAATRSER